MMEKYLDVASPETAPHKAYIAFRCVRVCVRAFVRACVRACVRVCVRVYTHVFCRIMQVYEYLEDTRY